MGVVSVLSFHAAQREFARFDNAGRFFLQTLLVTLLAGAAFVSAFIVQMRRDELRYTYARPLYGFAVRQWLPLSMVVLMFLMPVWYAALHEPNMFDESWITLPPTILANLAMLALAFWLLLIGLREERGFPFAAAVVYFLLWALMRYIDLFSEAGGMLGASCMFFTTGAVIFGGAMFWHRHKKQKGES